MVLNPLAEVGVRVLMAVLIGRGELMMNFQRRCKGRQREKDGADNKGEQTARPSHTPLVKSHVRHAGCFFTKTSPLKASPISELAL